MLSVTLLLPWSLCKVCLRRKTYWSLYVLGNRNQHPLKPKNFPVGSWPCYLNDHCIGNLEAWEGRVGDPELHFLELHLFICCGKVEEHFVRLLHFYGISVFKLEFYYRVLMDSVVIAFWRLSYKTGSWRHILQEKKLTLA